MQVYLFDFPLNKLALNSHAYIKEYWKDFNGNHYPGKGGIQPPRASLTDLMVMEV